MNRNMRQFSGLGWLPPHGNGKPLSSRPRTALSHSISVGNRPPIHLQKAGASSSDTLVTGKRLLIAAHGNSLRALVKYLDNIPESEIVSLNIPTGIPLVYELDENLKPIRSYYLGDAEAIKAAQEAVANQGKAQDAVPTVILNA